MEDGREDFPDGRLVLGRVPNDVVLFLGAQANRQCTQQGNDGDDRREGKPADWSLLVLTRSQVGEEGDNGNHDDGQPVPTDRTGESPE